MAGNPPPRIVETPCGMLNAIGLANVGLDAFLRDKLPKLRHLKTNIIVIIYGHRVDDYAELAAALKKVEGIAALEVNISCPNVECGGMVFGVDPLQSARVIERVVRNSDKPVIAKLSPNVTDIRAIAVAVETAGAHAISLINTIMGMAVDVETRIPKLPHIALRIQELYEVKTTPRIAMNRVPVLVHILAPSMRPVQITQDLAGFWRDHYPRIKQELQRQYPKHEWR